VYNERADAWYGNSSSTRLTSNTTSIAGPWRITTETTSCVKYRNNDDDDKYLLPWSQQRQRVRFLRTNNGRGKFFDVNRQWSSLPRPSRRLFRINVRTWTRINTHRNRSTKYPSDVYRNTSTRVPRTFYTPTHWRNLAVHSRRSTEFQEIQQIFFDSDFNIKTRTCVRFCRFVFCSLLYVCLKINYSEPKLFAV